MFYRRQACFIFLHCLVVVLLSACSRAPELSVVAAVDEAPGNITVTPDKRIIFSLHQFFAPDWRVAEWTPQGMQPFPNADIASANHPDQPTKTRADLCLSHIMRMAFLCSTLEFIF